MFELKLSDVHESFKNMGKWPCFEVETASGEFVLCDVICSPSGFEAVTTDLASPCYVEFDDFDYCSKATDCLDLMMQELYSNCVVKLMECR